MRTLRRDNLGTLSSYASKTYWYQDQHSQRTAKRAFDDYLDRIFAHIRAGRGSEAIVLLLENHEEYRNSIEIYEEIYNEILAWKQTRAVLCLSRLFISEYLTMRKYRKAIDVARNALEVTDEFAYAEPGQETCIKVLAEQQGLSLTDRNAVNFAPTSQ